LQACRRPAIESPPCKRKAGFLKRKYRLLRGNAAGAVHGHLDLGVAAHGVAVP
jgi:hypothetical protein